MPQGEVESIIPLYAAEEELAVNDNSCSRVSFVAHNMKREAGGISGSEEISMVSNARTSYPSRLRKPKLVEVHGFMVLEAHAPLVERIYAKYGDISSECNFSTPYVKTALMESLIRVVMIFQQKTTTQPLNEDEVILIQDSLRDLELAKLDVGWLKERYNAAVIPNELAEDAKTYERLRKMISKTSSVLRKLKADLEQVATQINKKRRKLVKMGSEGKDQLL